MVPPSPVPPDTPASGTSSSTPTPTPPGLSYHEPPAPTADPSEAADTRWMMAHYAELVERYPMSWIAIEDGHVVGHGGTRQAALRDALQRMGARTEAEARAAGHDPHLYFLERAADHLYEH